MVNSMGWRERQWEEIISAGFVEAGEAMVADYRRTRESPDLFQIYRAGWVAGHNYKGDEPSVGSMPKDQKVR